VKATHATPLRSGPDFLEGLHSWQAVFVIVEQRNGVAGLQHGQPAPGGGLGNAAIGGQAVEVEQVAGTGGAQRQETLEQGQVADPNT
jgi:hypothetical protein